MLTLISSKLDGLYYMYKGPGMEYAVQVSLMKGSNWEDFIVVPPKAWEPVCVNS